MNFAGSVRSSVGLLHNGQSWNTLKNKAIKPAPPSKTLVNASVVAFVGFVAFIMSFMSPYWLQSYEYTYDSFLNMGLWEFCFSRYRHFDFQYDKLYDGCNHVFSFEYQQIREWILPGWLMVTQALMTIALLSLSGCLVTLIIIVIRVPMKTIMRQEWKFMAYCVCLQAVTVLSVFLAVTIFGLMCWSRNWLLNPNFHYLSWSYGLAVISGILEGASCLMLCSEAYDTRNRKREQTNMLMMQEPSVQSIPLSGQGYI